MLSDMLTQYETRCYESGKSMVDQAKQQKSDLKIENQKEIRTMLRSYEIFSQFEIMTQERIQPKLRNFKNFIES